MQSMSVFDGEEKNKNDEKVGAFLQRIDNAVASFRLAFYHKVNHPIKKALFKLPRSCKRNEMNGRMRPKMFVLIAGLALVALSSLCLGYAIAKYAPSGSSIETHLPWLAFAGAAPLPIWIATALLGTWMMSSTPHQNREHGILNAMVANPERTFSADSIVSKYEKLSNSASKMFQVRDSFIGDSVRHFGIYNGIDDIVEAMSFGTIPIKEFSVAQEGTPCYALKGSKESEKRIYARYDEAVKHFDDIMDIWTSKMGLSMYHTKFAMTSFRDFDRAKKLEEIAELGRQLGVDQTVSAYISGVPLEDILA